LRAARPLREFRVNPRRSLPSTPIAVKAGATLGVDLFAVGQKVDVTGVTIARDLRRHQAAPFLVEPRHSHGNSVSHNAPGSIGMRQDPGRVMPGKRMAGHLGDVRRTTHNLVIARIDAQRSCCWSAAQFPVPRRSVIVRPG